MRNGMKKSLSGKSHKCAQFKFVLTNANAIYLFCAHVAVRDNFAYNIYGIITRLRIYAYFNTINIIVKNIYMCSMR